MKKKKYLPQISEKEIYSLIPNIEIYSKINFGSKIPIITISSEFHILYKTVCLETSQVYVGVRTTKNYKNDTYIGCGVDTKVYEDKLGISYFKRAVRKYGREKFIRENLLYFSSREDAARAEKIIVDKDWVNSEKTLNICLGGGYPPRKLGRENGNYGKKWTKDKRKELSSYFLENRDTKGRNNTRAIRCVIYCINKKIFYDFGCGKEVAEFTNLSYNSILTWLPDPEIMCKKVRKGGYILFTKDDFDKKINKIDINDFIKEVIKNSRYGKNYKL